MLQPLHVTNYNQRARDYYATPVRFPLGVIGDDNLRFDQSSLHTPKFNALQYLFRITCWHINSVMDSAQFIPGLICKRHHRSSPPANIPIIPANHTKQFQFQLILISISSLCVFPLPRPPSEQCLILLLPYTRVSTIKCKAGLSSTSTFIEFPNPVEFANQFCACL